MIAIFKKSLFCLLVGLLMLFTGCQSQKENVLSQESESFSGETTESSINSAEDSDTGTDEKLRHAEYGISPMKYEEYFGEERYFVPVKMDIRWSMTLPYIEIGSAINTEVIRLYTHDTVIENCIGGDSHILFFRSGQSLYRLFLGAALAEEIFSSEEEYWFYPITNYQTMILFCNPAFDEALSQYGDALPSDHPNPYIPYLYDVRSRELTPFDPQSLGYASDMDVTLIPREEIVPLE